MAAIRKKGRRWEAAVARKGIRKSSTFATKLEAQVWAADVERAIVSGGYLINDHSVEDLLQRYLSAVSVKKRGADKEKIRIMRLCRDPVAQLKLSELRPSHMAEWRDRLLQDVTEATVQRYWNLFSHAFTVAVNEWQWLSENPLKKVARPKSGPPRDRRISQDEIDRLLFALGYDVNSKPETVTARVGAAFLFAIETAMRAGEIVSLTWQNVDVEKRVARLPKTKNGFPRDVPLSVEAVGILEHVRKGAESVFNLRSIQNRSHHRRRKNYWAFFSCHFPLKNSKAAAKQHRLLSILR